MLDLIAVRRHLHSIPERAFSEHKTGAFITETLASLGLSPHKITETGIAVDIGCHLPPENITAFRADIDALPITEETGLPYASTHPGMMHACGHDLHTAVAIGLAERLAQRADALPARVRIIFQPAEEVLSGARPMIEAGVLDGVSRIFAFHGKPELTAGTVGINPCTAMAASAKFTVRVQGVGGHGSAPHLARDPIAAASAMVCALQNAVSRIRDPRDPAVVSVCGFHAGTAHNIIPGTAELIGTARYFSDSLQAALPQMLRETLEGIAAAHRCEVSLDWAELVRPLKQDPELVIYSGKTAAALLGEDNVFDLPADMGSEDFSLFCEQIPGCLVWLGTGTPGDPAPRALHNSGYALDERALATGVDLAESLILGDTP